MQKIKNTLHKTKSLKIVIAIGIIIFTSSLGIILGPTFAQVGANKKLEQWQPLDIPPDIIESMVPFHRSRPRFDRENTAPGARMAFAFSVPCDRLSERNRTCAYYFYITELWPDTPYSRCWNKQDILHYPPPEPPHGVIYMAEFHKCRFFRILPFVNQYNFAHLDDGRIWGWRHRYLLPPFFETITKVGGCFLGFSLGILIVLILLGRIVVYRWWTDRKLKNGRG